MAKRFWLLGVAGLISVALLVACGSKYNSSSQGLVLVGSQGSSVIQTYSFNLNTGHAAAVSNSTNDTGNQTCLLNGSPADMVVNPAGTFAFVVFNSSTQCPNATNPGIAVFQIKSDGTLAQVGELVGGAVVSLAMDAAGKFLFAAQGSVVGVFAIAADGKLTPAGEASPIGLMPQTPNIVAVAATPTVFPGTGINGTQNSVCSVPGNNPPTSQYLYAVDATNYVVWEYAVDTSTGALANPPGTTTPPSFSTEAVPAGIAVDPCDRFVYVSGSLHNKLNAYTICTSVIAGGACPEANGALVDVSGSPFAVSGSANGLGPLVVDPFGNHVYVVGTFSNTVSAFKISPVSGSLTALNPATVATGTGPKSIAIRQDNNWMFVTNYGSVGQGGSTVSQYSITPATGALSVLPTLQTDNYPFGVAVK